jgi:hypothetical protein
VLEIFFQLLEGINNKRTAFVAVEVLKDNSWIVYELEKDLLERQLTKYIAGEIQDTIKAFKTDT